MKLKPCKSPYYPELDGVRGIAIILVLIYHTFAFASGSQFGWVGVDLFFVLSGFLITDILLRTRSNDRYLFNFYSRRALRILPLYYLSLLIFFFVLPLVNFNLADLSFYSNHQLWFWGYLQNILVISKHSADKSQALHHFWSLAVEEQYYFVWPFVIVMIRRPQRIVSFLLLSLFALILFRSLIWIVQIKQLNYYGLYKFTRIDGLLMGSLLSTINSFRPKFIESAFKYIIGFLLILNGSYAILTIACKTSLPYFATAGYPTITCLFALFLNWVLQQKDHFITSFLRFQPLRSLGKISYGLYVIHWPVYIILHAYVLGLATAFFSTSRVVSEAIVSISLICLALVLSALSYHYFERRFLELKKKFV